MQTRIDKAASKQEKEQADAQRIQTRGEEASALLAASPVTQTPRAQPQVPAAAVHVFPREKDFKHPEFVTFSIGADSDFMPEWVKQQHTESALSKECDQPYGISAGAWAEKTKGLPSVWTAFRRFIGIPLILRSFTHHWARQSRQSTAFRWWAKLCAVWCIFQSLKF